MKKSLPNNLSKEDLAIIISPSGNLYGSEKVLLDYLRNTKLTHQVWIPRKSLLMHTATRLGLNHDLREFSSTSMLFLCLFWQLLKKPKAKHVYCNEGGFNRYIIAMCRLFPNKSFKVHLRIIEDLHPNRWPRSLPKNFLPITISRFMANMAPFSVKYVYDPYHWSLDLLPPLNDEVKKEILILGRIGFSKGLSHYVGLFKWLEANVKNDKIPFFHFYGDVSEEIANSKDFLWIQTLPWVKIHGYEPDQSQIFSVGKILLHLAEQEPLGRIVLEAIDRGLPLILANNGGVREIAMEVGIEDFTVNPISPIDIWGKICDVSHNYEEYTTRVRNAKLLAQEIFCLSTYTSHLEKEWVNVNNSSKNL